MPGEYKITVLLSEVDKSAEAGDPMQQDERSKMAFFSRMSPGARAREQLKKQRAPKVVPEVYSDLKRTPLKCTVPVDGKVELELKSTAR